MTEAVTAQTSRFRRAMAVQEMGVLIALFLLCMYLSYKSPVFHTQSNLLSVARQASYYGIMAVGMVFVISLGEIDLSVGSILTLTDMTLGLALRAKWPLFFAIPLGLAVGAACGFLNGILTVTLKIPTIIVTLGTLSVFRGTALLLSDGSPISQFSKDGPFFTVGGGAIFGIPASVLLMFIAMIGGWIIISRTVFGRRVLAIGSNAQTSRLSGISLNKYRVAVMTLNGVMAAVAGIAALAFLQSADPTNGQGYELWVIASVIIGGTALSGGHGSVPGAILGALIIAVIANGLVLLDYSNYVATIITGGVIILAVAIDAFVKRRSRPT